MASDRTFCLSEVNPQTCRIAVKMRSLERVVLNQEPLCLPGDI